MEGKIAKMSEADHMMVRGYGKPMDVTGVDVVKDADVAALARQALDAEFPDLAELRRESQARRGIVPQAPISVFEPGAGK